MGRKTHDKFWAIANSCWIVESILHHLIAGFLIKFNVMFSMTMSGQSSEFLYSVLLENDDAIIL